MRKFINIMAIVVVVILTATVSVSFAWERTRQATFRTPGGGFVQHQGSGETHLIGNDTWNETSTYTPGELTKKTRITRTLSKTWTRENLDPKCNNPKGPLTDKTFEQEDICKIEDLGEEIMGANSGANPSLVNVTLPAAFNGAVGSTTQGAFYYAGQKARRPSKFTFNGGNATNNPSPVTATTGPTTAITGPQTQFQGQDQRQDQAQAETQVQTQ